MQKWVYFNILMASSKQIVSPLHNSLLYFLHISNESPGNILVYFSLPSWNICKLVLSHSTNTKWLDKGGYQFVKDWSETCNWCLFILQLSYFTCSINFLQQHVWVIKHREIIRLLCSILQGYAKIINIPKDLMTRDVEMLKV